MDAVHQSIFHAVYKFNMHLYKPTNIDMKMFTDGWAGLFSIKHMLRCMFRHFNIYIDKLID